MDNQSFFWAVTNRAGVKAFNEGSLREAEGYFAQALAYAEQHFAAHDARVNTSRDNLRETRFALGKETNAAAAATTCDASMPDLHALGEWDRHFRAAVEAQNQGRFTQAEELFTTASLFAGCFRNSDTRLADTFAGKASCLTRLGRMHDAEPFYFKALEIRTAAGDDIHPATASIYSALALIQVWRRRFDYAKKLAWKAIEIRLQVVSPEHPDLGQDLHTLAAVYHAQRDYQEAEPLYRRSLSILQHSLGVENELVEAARKNFASMLQETERGACGTGEDASEAMEKFKLLLSHCRSAAHPQT